MTINILIDFETAAMNERAAILSMGAVPFVLPSDNICYLQPFKSEGNESTLQEMIDNQGVFFATINATSCIMEGMEFDQQTVDWWSRQSDQAKEQFSDHSCLMNIQQAYIALIAYIRNIKNTFGCDIQIWTQGTDFDIPKLRYGCTKIADMPESQLPWRYYNVRDARTYIIEGLAMLNGRKSGKELYADIPKNPEAVNNTSHDVLSDCRNSIWNVTQVNLMLMNAMKEAQD